AGGQPCPARDRGCTGGRVGKRRHFPPVRSGKVVSHGRYVAFQMAEVAMPALSHPLPRHVILHTM
ncbi:MAG: hypothetical protein WB820_04915, partial [Rhodoplanes sp.]